MPLHQRNKDAKGKNLQGSIDTGANDMQSFQSQALPVKLPQHELLYSGVHRSCQELASSVVFSQRPSLLGSLSALMWGPPWAPERRHSCPTTIPPWGTSTGEPLGAGAAPALPSASSCVCRATPHMLSLLSPAAIPPAQ